MNEQQNVTDTNPITEVPQQPSVQPMPEPAPPPSSVSQPTPIPPPAPPADSAPLPPQPAPTAQAGASSNKGMAILAYLGILIIVPFVTEAKNDPFVKFHIKQGLVLLITWVIANFLWAIPVLGWFASPIINLGCFILMILGIINVAGGQTKELPIIGQFARSFNF